ncbi:MAG: biopolymer transporter ExbD [Parvibaculum sp.]
MVLRHPRPKIFLSLTPLIDVVFILLIFFMLVSQFSDWRKIELIPQAGLSAVLLAEEKSSSLRLRNDGLFVLNGETVGELRTAVAHLVSWGRDEVIVLSSEDLVEIQRVVDTIEALNTAGLTKVQLSEVQGGEMP